MNFIQTKNFKLAVYFQGDQNAEKLALVIPGKLDSKDFAHMHSLIDFLASKGFLAVTFDPPGTWESEGSIENYIMTNYLKAVDEIIEYFGNRPTLLVGHSRGGKIAYIAGSNNPHIEAYVAIMGKLPEKTEIKEDDEWKEKGFRATLRSLPPGTGPRVKEFHLPYSFYEDEMKYFLTDEIKNCTKPKLLIKGTKDTTVLPEKVEKVYSALSLPKELDEVDSDHDYLLHPEVMEEINKLVEKFVNKYNL